MGCSFTLTIIMIIKALIEELGWAASSRLSSSCHSAASGFCSTDLFQAPGRVIINSTLSKTVHDFSIMARHGGRYFETLSDQQLLIKLMVHSIDLSRIVSSFNRSVFFVVQTNCSQPCQKPEEGKKKAMKFPIRNYLTLQIRHCKLQEDRK